MSVPPKAENETYKDYYFRVLTNFHLRFPLEPTPSGEISYMLWCSMIKGKENTPHCMWTDCRNNSILYSNQTPIEFDKAVENAVQAAGIDRQKLLSQLKNWTGKKTVPEKVGKEVCATLIVLYEALISQGYKHEDLCS